MLAFFAICFFPPLPLPHNNITFMGNPILLFPDNLSRTDPEFAIKGISYLTRILSLLSSTPHD